MAARRAPIFGPEEWASVGGVAWSHWDRWYSAVCLAEADGDWSRLAEVLATRSGRVHLGSDAEAKLSHLDDLARRLDAAGLGPADLAGELDKAEMAKARRKVLDQGLSGRDLTPAMRDTPRRRLRERALRGSWAAFPADPSAAYAALGAGVEEAGHVGKGGTFELVREVEAACGPDRRPGGCAPRGRLLRGDRGVGRSSVAGLRRHTLAGPPRPWRLMHPVPRERRAAGDPAHQPCGQEHREQHLVRAPEAAGAPTHWACEATTSTGRPQATTCDSQTAGRAAPMRAPP